jgi:hypothetical protein
MITGQNDAHVQLWTAYRIAGQHRSHVGAWVKHHACELSRKPLAEGFHLQALHEYTDTYGDPLHWRIRLKHPDTGEKWIRPMRRGEKGFELKQPDYLNGTPPYRLHELALQSDESVWIVEGEACADKLSALGLQVTTSGAADSANKADWSILFGRPVSVWPDNDDAGQRYAESVKTKLESIGCTVTMIDVEALGLPPKGDCVDWLAMNPNATTADIDRIPTIASPGSAKGAPKEAVETNALPETIAESDAAIVSRLAALPALEYDRCRVVQAKAMGVRQATLDRLVKSERADEDATQTPFAEPEPWHEPIDPTALLNEVAETVRRFIVLEPKQADAAALWVAFTWFAEVVEVAPLAIINAPEKACGKSQLLTLFGRLVARPLPAANSTAAFLFRAVELWEPTVLIDEADTFIRENEELKGLVNAGHTRQNAFVGRVVGDNHEPKLFKVWGAKALAGIALEKHLPDSTMSRAVVFNMRRKLAGESVERLRHADAGMFDRLASMLARFADDYREQVRTARPSLPDELGDRAQDNWEPLLSVAQSAGAEWVRRATASALELSGVADTSQSAGNELLSDIQHVFEMKELDRISTADLIAALMEDDEAAWATYNRGKPLAPRQLAKMLAGYGIKSKNIRKDYEQFKGFDLAQFVDAFTRYLSPSPETSRPAVPSAANPINTDRDVGRIGNSWDGERQTGVPLKPPPNKGWDGGTDKTLVYGSGENVLGNVESF